MIGTYDREQNMRRVEQILAAGTHTLSQVDEIRRAARKSKPGTQYDADSAEKAAYYHRRAHLYTLAELQRRYPNSASRMPQVSVDMMRHIAVTDAVVYDECAERWITYDGVRAGETPKIEGDEGLTEEVDPLTERDERFAEMLRAARVDFLMREAERRVLTTKTLFVRLGWDEVRQALDGIGRPTLTLYWPHEVDVLCHPDAPADMRAAIAIIAQRAGDQQKEGKASGAEMLGTSGVVELWTRAYSQDVETGKVSFGEWHAEIIDAKGSTPMYGDGVYPLTDAPWLVMHDGIADRSIFADDDTDILTVARAINVTWSATLYHHEMSGFAQAYATGTESMDGKPMVTAPGAVWHLPEGATVGQLPTGFNLDGVKMLEGLVGTVATTREQSPSAYSADPSSVAESGVARKIRNIPQERAARERRENWRDFEEHTLLPALTAVWDYWDPEGRLIAHGPRGEGYEGALDTMVEYHVHFEEGDDYEDPTEKEQRLKAQYDDGLITFAARAVALGIFATEEEAIEEYGEEKAGYKKASAPVAPMLSQRLAPPPVPPNPRQLREDLSAVPDRTDGEQ